MPNLGTKDMEAISFLSSDQMQKTLAKWRNISKKVTKRLERLNK